MDREEASTEGTINAVNRYAGIEVSLYLSPAGWQDMLASGSAEVTQSFGSAPEDARIVRVTVYRP